MGRIFVTMNVGTDEEITLPLEQVVQINRLSEALGDAQWHRNKCGCCVTVHPKGQHDRGYIIDQDGGYEWIGPGGPDADA